MSVITVKPEAIDHMRALMAKQPDAIGIRLGTAVKGCSGLGYDIDYVTKADPTDEVIETDAGFSLFVPRTALLHLFGTEIGWEDSMFSTGFTFTNPNEKGRCGCGESFMV
ncbi:iron-sulfur cluster assembly accessory protein [Temperatibacter marinus]|uniref:Iron-sulfur cluster assembly accessory protein n=1 Tax=Temperatibacter marinus TaxID=1456591 RepID=A0AA52HBM1_9PROT|nr:iron-sulfur cluster assembly accessory protein [Temperatibacter marinus]WND03773.1 iron-sulfur cluster assembly accessory protein [Temperatibacter marinus]